MTDKMPDEIYIADTSGELYPPFYSKKPFIASISHKYISEQKHTEILKAHLGSMGSRCLMMERKHAEEIAAKQAVIDRLMLEYCPDEMSEQQLDDYRSSQVSVDLCGPEIAALKAKHRAEMAGLCDEIESTLTVIRGIDSYCSGWNGCSNEVRRNLKQIKQRISDWITDD